MIKIKDLKSWEDSIGQVVNGDCMELMKMMPDKCIDLILTDPPYGIEWKPSILFGKSTPQTKSLKDLQNWDKKPNKKLFNWKII